MRDQVCITLLDKVYSDLNSREQTLLDGQFSSGSLPLAEPTSGLTTGVAKDAFIALTQFFQWFGEAGSLSANAPSAFEHVVKAEIVARMALALRHPEAPTWINNARAAVEQAVETYAVNDFSDSSQLFGTSALSIQRIRLHVIRHCVRRRPRRIMPPVAEIDLAFKWALNHLSQRGAWMFRTRDITIAVATASDGSAPTITGLASGETFDSLLSTQLFYKDTTQQYTAEAVDWAYPDDWARARSEWADTTGRPQMFRIEMRAGTAYWQWCPRPDQAYTLQGLALVRTPSLPSAATDTAVIAKYPPEFESIFPDLVLAKVLRDFSAPGWEDLWTRVNGEIERWAEGYQKTGQDFRCMVPIDVYNDPAYQSSGGM